MQSSTVELSLLLFVIGVGVGPQLSVTTTAIQNAVPKGQMGVATAGLTLARQVGSSIGLAGLTTIFIYKIENSSIKNKEKLFSMDGQTGLNMSKVLTLPEDKKFLFQNLFADGL